jgi:hypothetical protein
MAKACEAVEHGLRVLRDALSNDLARSTRKRSLGESVMPDFPFGPIRPNTRAGLPLRARVLVAAVRRSLAGSRAAVSERARNGQAAVRENAHAPNAPPDPCVRPCHGWHGAIPADNAGCWPRDVRTSTILYCFQ